MPSATELVLDFPFSLLAQFLCFSMRFQSQPSRFQIGGTA